MTTMLPTRRLGWAFFSVVVVWAMAAPVGALAPLAGRVAVVTGASRGIGKGIALELGAAGVIVYCCARSSRTTQVTTERALGDGVEATVEATCEEIGALGGVGIPIVYDANEPATFASLVQRIEAKEGRLDVLVCSAFTTPPQLASAGFRDDFWKQGLPMWDACHGVGLRASYAAACDAVPLMIDTARRHPEARPLVVHISSFGGKSYTFNVAYGVGKAAIDRLSRDMAVQLAPHGVDTVSLYPGVVRTEGNMEMDRRGDWAEASGGLDLTKGESPRYTGRALVELLRRPDLCKAQSGSVQVVAELAGPLDFRDVDGSRPPSIRSLAFILPNFVLTKDAVDAAPGPVRGLLASVRANAPDCLLPWDIFTAGPPPQPDSS